MRSRLTMRLAWRAGSCSYVFSGPTMGWLKFLRVQRANHADSWSLPAPGRSCNVPPSMSWRVVDGGMVNPLNTQVAASVPYCQPLGDDMGGFFCVSSPSGWLKFLRVQRANHVGGWFYHRCQLLGDHVLSPLPGAGVLSTVAWLTR
ncbi:hypothetical protein VN97_g4607 [Penicillium thymicola]|uniref:Uncharacterized protein n=1 Tax=Penicillium thymicola TaxID=293382 RepID=A0AAI9TL13_PENTH|nr:hypothetical protein VN97_g4607 [Penicillium thymicola]